MVGERRGGLWEFVLLVISMLLSAGLAAMGKYMGGALPEPLLHALAFYTH